MKLAANYPGIDTWILNRLSKVAGFLGDYNTICALGEDDSVLAAVAFDGFTPYECCIHLVVDDLRGVSRGSLREVFRYPFQACGLLRLSASVSADNSRSIRLIERLGFTKEGVKRQSIDGIDEIIYGMLRKECKWI